MGRRRSPKQSRASENRETVRSPSRISFHEDFESSYLDHERTLAVYLPPGYDSDSNLHCPVFYLHNGQNLFDPQTAAVGVAWDLTRLPIG